jgi:hypothetical protein
VHDDSVGLYDEGWGDGSALGSVSSHQFRRSHLIYTLVAPCDDNRVVIVLSNDG